MLTNIFAFIRSRKGMRFFSDPFVDNQTYSYNARVSRIYGQLREANEPANIDMAWVNYVELQHDYKDDPDAAVDLQELHRTLYDTAQAVANMNC